MKVSHFGSAKFWGWVLVFLVWLSSPSFSQELFKLKWKRYVGKYNNYWGTNQPLIFGRYVLHASDGDKDDEKDSYDKLYLFDENGNLIWSFEGKDNMNGVVACADFIVATDEDGYVYAISWDGELLWKFRASGNWVHAMSLGDLDGDGYLDVVVGSCDKYVYALSGKDGKLLWKFETGRLVDSSPALGDLNGDGILDVVVGSEDNYVYALSGKDGKLLWKFETGRLVDSSPALGDLDGDGYLDVVVGSCDDYVYALSGRDGRLLWKFKTGGTVWSSPALGDLDGDGYLDVVVGSCDDYVYALSGRDGSLLWKFKTGDSVQSSPALGDLDGDGYLDVVVGSGDHYVYALSGKDGRILWKFGTGFCVGSSPALGDLDGDGYLNLAVASRDGYLYVFEATKKGGRVVWSRWHGDSAGTGVYENAVSFAEANLSGKAFAWKPYILVSYEYILNIAKTCNLCSFQKITYKLTPYAKINEAKRKRAIKKGIQIAKNYIKRKTAEKIKEIVEKLSSEAELTDKKTVNAIYNNMLSQAFKKIDRLQSYAISEPQKGTIYLLVNADRVINLKQIEDRVVDLIARAIEGEEIKVVAKVEIPELEISAQKSSEITITTLPSGGFSSGGSKITNTSGASPRSCVKPHPNYYLFGVVVYDYKELSDLNYVKNDKKLIYRLATCYMGVPRENIKIFENPSYAYLKTELRRFAGNINQKDAVLYFYYSGHGVLDSKGKFYILPADASIEDEWALKDSGVDIDTLKRLLARAKGKKVAFIDACRISPPWKPAVLIYKPKLTHIAMIFSTQRGQLSNADKERRHSAFTRALYEMASAGLVNLDFDEDGYIEIKELIKPLTNWVRKVSADKKQTPDAWGPMSFEVFPVE